MNILSNIRSFFNVFFNFRATSSKQTVFRAGNQGHTEAKSNFCFSVHLRNAHEYPQSSFKAESLISRVNPNVSSHYSNFNSLTQNVRSSENYESQDAFSRFQAQETLDQSLQLQINQLQNENNSMLSRIGTNHSDANYSRPIHSLSTFQSKENEDKFNELKKLDLQLSNISNFCNEEMIEVLKIVSEACFNLEGKLTSLRKETAVVTDDLQLFENIEHIGHLEKILESLHQLETKFQGMQKDILVKGEVRAPVQSPKEAQVSLLLEKIEKLNREKELLESSKKILPGQAVYDLKELQDLIKVSESERDELVQKLNVTRRKHTLARQFGSEMTNHLLDYAEMFKGFVPKLRNKVSLPATDLSNFRSKAEVKPLLSLACNNMSLATQAQKVQVSNEENSNANEFKFAAAEVAKALRELMEVAIAPSEVIKK